MKVEARWPTAEELLKRMNDRRNHLLRSGYDPLGEIPILDRTIARIVKSEQTRVS